MKPLTLYSFKPLVTIILVATVFCLCSATTLFAQKEIYREDFNGPVKWYTGEFNSETIVAVKDGRYTIERRDSTNYVYFYENVDIDFTKNWSIETTLRQPSGDNSHGVGVVFGSKDVNNFYEFVTSADGQFRVNRFTEGSYREFMKWTEHSAIKKGVQDNVLMIRKVNDAMTFFVNDKPVFSMAGSFYAYYGNRVGFIVHGFRTLEADNIVVRQWEPDPVQTIANAETTVKLVNLGRAINDTSSDIVNCISADGSVLLLSRSYHPGNVAPIEKRDVWMSTRNEDGSWSKAVSVGPPINNESQNFAVTISPDLNTIVLQNQYDANGKSSGPGLSVANRTKDGWAVPTNMIVDNLSNSGSYTSSHVSPDGLVLITSIEFADTRGSRDLYVCFRKDDGTWTTPKNMGNVLNTQGSEYGPFIAGDGRTLYFSSIGHPGYGGADIYVTRRLDDTWTNWSKPLNLGKGINSDETDAFFKVPAQGDSAYFSSTKSGFGSDDIFSVALPVAARPEPVIIVRGRVLHALTKEPLEATVRYEILPSGRQAGLARSNPTTGKYAVALPAGEQYGVRAEAQGFYPLSEQFTAKELKKYVEIERDLFLVPIADGAVVRLNNVFFDFGKHELRAESFPELDRLVVFLKANAAMNIELGGHTDNVGEDAANKTLSQNRVNSVLTYLVSKTIPAPRLRAKGYGETRPVGTNDTEDGRQQNRRVEFTILNK